MYERTTPLGELLEAAEERRGVTRGQAADLIGISRQSYLGWKRGAAPHLSNLQAISAFCGVPVRTVLAAVGIESTRTYDLDTIPGYRAWGRDNVVEILAAA